MASASIMDIYKLGKELGHTGEALSQFVKQFQADERQRRNEERELKKLLEEEEEEKMRKRRAHEEEIEEKREEEMRSLKDRESYNRTD
jgi:LPS O-antigen subunit length determinant protein (WzzB/FepE family)